MNEGLTLVFQETEKKLTQSTYQMGSLAR